MERLNRIHHSTVTLWSEDGYPIVGDFRCPDTEKKLPIIVICHSFMAFKDWGFFPYIGERFAAAGFATFAFNFSFDGVQDSEDRISDFGKFEQNTFSREIKDCESVLAAIREGELHNEIVDTGKVILLGHSRGGGIAIVTASRHADVKALVSMSSIATFDRWTEHQKRNWRERGFLSLAKETIASPLRLGIGLLDDLEWNGEEIRITKAASKITQPWLIVHGKMDVTVPHREAEQLFAAANNPAAEIVVLDKVGHLYHASTREEDNYATLNHILELVIAWLHKHF
jgi:pimeloyl-ACP methyl ester carboxylesterase